MNIKELAKKLNLSITTVSRALGGYSDVSEKTREKVKKFAQKYNYSPNLYASALASGRSKTVGYVLPIYGTHSSTLNQILLGATPSRPPITPGMRGGVNLSSK